MRQVKEDGKMGGRPYIEGTRVRVSDVAVKFYDNESDISASIDMREAS